MSLRIIMSSRFAGAAARPGAARRALKDRTAPEAALEPEPPVARRVGWGFISLYTLAYMSTTLLFLAPVLVTLALKVDSLVGIKRAPSSLALVAGIGALVALVGNPFFGKMSDRTASRLGMRRPWMVTGLVADVVSPLHRQRRQLKRGDPALGAGLQRGHVPRRQLQAHHPVEVRRVSGHAVWT